jgi:hypothetical protein
LSPHPRGLSRGRRGEGDAAERREEDPRIDRVFALTGSPGQDSVLRRLHWPDDIGSDETRHPVGAVELRGLGIGFGETMLAPNKVEVSRVDKDSCPLRQG